MEGTSHVGCQISWSRVIEGRDPGGAHIMLLCVAQNFRS